VLDDDVFTLDPPQRVQLFTKPLDGREWLMGQKTDPFRRLILLREGKTRPCRDRAGERAQKFPSLHASPPHREAIPEFVSPTTLRRGLCKGRVLLSLRTASPMLMRFGSLLRPAFKKIFDRAACARQARRYGANRHALHLRDFTICEALQNDQQQSMTL